MGWMDIQHTYSQISSRAFRFLHLFYSIFIFICYLPTHICIPFSSPFFSSPPFFSSYLLSVPCLKLPFLAKVADIPSPILFYFVFFPSFCLGFIFFHFSASRAGVWIS